MSRNPFGELPKNLAQAVDLSSLGKPTMPLPEFGMEITQANLVAEILPASNNQVVIALCWSPRSTQSREILNILGDFHNSDSLGSNPWILATVNVDSETAVAQALQVQSVPIAIAIIQEQIVPLFESVPPRDQVRMVIDKVLSLAAERGIGTTSGSDESPATEAPMEPEEIEALDALEKNDLDTAITAYKRWLIRSPGNAMAEIGLAQVELMKRVEGQIPSEVLSLAQTQPSDIKIQLMAADLEVIQGNYESAFNRVISLVRELSGEEKKSARDHLLALFKLIDPTDPQLIKARQALASALF